MVRSVVLPSLALAVCACSSPEYVRDSGIPDAAGGSDGMIAPGVAKVTVQDQGTPLMGAPVEFLNPDGSEIGVVMTDAMGVASMTVPPYAIVNAGVRPGMGQVTWYGLTTIYGVMPGDNLTVGAGPAYPGIPANVGSSTTSTFTNFGGATSQYWIRNGCNYTTATAPPAAAPITLAMNPSCIHSGSIDVGIADHNTQNLTIAFGSATGTISGASPSETATANPVLSAVTQNTGVSLIDVPNDVQGSRFEQYSYHGDLMFDDQSVNNGGGQSSVSFGNAPGSFIDNVETQVEIYYPQDSNLFSTYSYYEKYGPQTASNLTVDGTLNMLPRIYDMAVVHQTATGIPTLEWNQDRPLLADGAGFLIYWTNAAVPSTSFYWTAVFRPGTVTSMTMPTLATELAAWAMPLAPSQLEIFGFVAAQSPQIGGWDNFRGQYSMYLDVNPNRPMYRPKPTGSFLLAYLTCFNSS
jgi:hypothetical protein